MAAVYFQKPEVVLSQVLEWYLGHVKSWSAPVDRSLFWVGSTTYHLNPRVCSKVSWINPILRTHDLSDVTYDVIQHDGRQQIAGNVSFLLFCYCLSNWQHEITTVKYIIDCRWKQTWTMNQWVASCTVESKRLFLFVGAHPWVQKRWMTLGLHPWVRWISFTGVLHNLTRPWSKFVTCNKT